MSIGLISFAAVAQFAPAVLGGIFWKGGTRRGALAGLSAGFAVWVYTLLLPAFARSGWLPIGFSSTGPSASRCSSRSQLFGLAGLDQITHAMIWSMVANIGAYVGVSLLHAPSADEQRQASLFVDVFQRPDARAARTSGAAPRRCADLHALLARFIGADAARRCVRELRARSAAAVAADALQADADLVHFVETQLAGAIGAASARIMVASAVQGRGAGASRKCGHPRRGVAGDGLQPPARAEVARAGGAQPPSCARPTSG